MYRSTSLTTVVFLVTTELIISSSPALMPCDGHSASQSCRQVVHRSGILLPRLPQLCSKDTRSWEDKLPHAMVTRTPCHSCGCINLRNMRLTAKEFSRAVNFQPSKGFAFHSEFVIKFRFFPLFSQDTDCQRYSQPSKRKMSTLEKRDREINTPLPRKPVGPQVGGWNGLPGKGECI